MTTAHAVPRSARYEHTIVPHLPFLRALAQRYTNNDSEAEDLVQETCLKALVHFHRFKPGTNARAWTARILRNTFLNRVTSCAARLHVALPEEEDADCPRKLSSSLPDPHEALCLRGEEETVAGIVACLSPRYRDPLRLSMEGFSYREIAQRLGVPPGTVMSRIYRARRHLVRIVGPAPPKRGLRTRARDLRGQQAAWT